MGESHQSSVVSRQPDGENQTVMLNNTNKVKDKVDIDNVKDKADWNNIDNLEEDETDLLLDTMKDDGQVMDLLGQVVENEQLGLGNFRDSFFDKISKLHTSKCLVQVMTNKNESKKIYIQHLLPLEYYFKFSYSKVVKIHAIIILACSKFRRASGKVLNISRLRSSLAEGLVEPGGIQQLADLVEENQSLPVTIREAGTLPLFTNDMDQIDCFEEAWEKAKNKHENISCHNLHFLKKNNQLKTILHSPHIPMFLKRHPMMARTMKMVSYGWNSLKDLRDMENKDLAQKKMMRVVATMGQLADLHFYMGEARTDLATLVAADLVTMLRKIWQTQTTKNMFNNIICKITNREQFKPAKNMFNHLHSDFTVLSRLNPRNLTMVDLFRSKEELRRINKMAATHLTLKCGQELRESYPSRLIKSQTCTSMHLPGVHFLKSRFHNLQVAMEEHEQAFKNDLQMRGFNPCPILLSPLSPLSW